MSEVVVDVAQGSLAYVFWHWPRPGADPGAYETDLAFFQQRLRSAGVPDLRAVTAFRLDEAPWAHVVAAPPAPPVYEDWYVVSGFAALDGLNTAAVSTALRSAHDRAAAGAAGGTAGLYRLRRAGAHAAGAVAHWLTKPEEMEYEELDALLESAAPDGSVWQRQLVLGPGAEFCLTAPAAVALPPGSGVRVVLRKPVG